MGGRAAGAGWITGACWVTGAGRAAEAGWITEAGWVMGAGYSMHGALPSSSRMLWEIEEQENELFKQGEEMFNLQVTQNEMEDKEDEKHRMRDEEARSQRASHSYRVIQALAQIYRPSRSTNLDRSSAFPDTYFRSHFRMELHLFNKIMTVVCNHDSYFLQKKDAFGVTDLIPEQKITTTLRVFAYGVSADQVDKIVRMGKSTILKSLMRFCFTIKSIHTAEYLRKLTKMDLQRLLKKVEM
ncbi:uncharacterized protein [Malus domestica]|uniref:uncharacterized protein n=1 Tax=Malus domestica TaxID=3750 RepID=UPI0039758806